MTKKILYVAIVCFVIALSALIAQKVFFSGERNQEEKVANNQADAGKKAKEEVEQRTEEQNAKWSEKIVKIIEFDVKGATIAGNSSQILYYQNQRFLLADFNGEKRNSIGAYPFVEVNSIEWNSKKQKALVKDRGSYYLYDLNDNSVNELDKDIDVAAWDNKGEKVLYKYFNQDEQRRGLAIMDPFQQSNRQGIVDELPFKKIDILAVPKTSQACIYPHPDVSVSGQCKCYDWRTNEEVFSIEGSAGSDYSWSPDGKRLLISSLQQDTRNRLLLGATNEQGSEFKGLGFSTTVKKCVWSQDNEHVFCAMMGGMSELAMLPNDWESEKYYSIDTFWKINTLDGKKERLIDAEKIPTNIDAEYLFVDSEERYVFFTDRKTGNLYRLSLR